MKTEKLQLGIIVDDLDRAIARAERTFEIGPFRQLDVPEAGVRAAMADWAGVEVELIAAATDEARGEHRRFLKGRPAKLAHIGAYVPDRKQAVEKLKTLGVPLIYEDIGSDDTRTALADLRGETGFLLELLERVS